ncbi:MAG: hypothetical protein R3C69_01995 [Geminicoccaceae bacterium]
MLHRYVAGLLLQAVYLGGVFAALALGVEAGASALIVGLQPLLVAAVAAPLLGERVTRRQWLGLAMGLLEVGLVVLGEARPRPRHAFGRAPLSPRSPPASPPARSTRSASPPASTCASAMSSVRRGDHSPQASGAGLQEELTIVAARAVVALMVDRPLLRCGDPALRADPQRAAARVAGLFFLVRRPRR